MRLTFGEIAQFLDQPGPVPDGYIDGASVDSREIKKGDLFVCVPGEKVDGHSFARLAEENGAAAILASRDMPEIARVPVFNAPDTVAALGKIAAGARRKTRAKVICLTGTAGKTTLKDALATIFSRSRGVVATKKNHNNQIGLPLTILNAAGDEDIWILEAGISHEQDMDELGSIARPDIAILLNVGPGHIAGLGKSGVAASKARLLNWLSADGIGLVNGDYPELCREAGKLRAKAVFFGEGTSFSLKEIDAINGKFNLNLNGEILSIRSPYIGSWGGEIALAAATAAKIAGVDSADIREGLARAARPDQRFRLIRVGEWSIFDDTYNANPLSMARMIGSASAYARSFNKPLYLVLGEMGELGSEAENWHNKLGEIIGEANPVAVFWKGGMATAVKEGIGDHSPSFCEIRDPQEFIQEWISRPRDEGVILFKGSRANRMEVMLEILQPVLRTR
ncbi:MAG: UDP-N-acetylmuramoyl-tripeptide--D-alanyl-D-alanine ligase [Desulfovibrio sp.]|nr:UDP-N-acetylmuramoyl-tripeptide--D-alanyl-D-alanine ligase [Desulfovibrio sp.]